MKFYSLILVMTANFTFVCSVAAAAPRIYVASATGEIRFSACGCLIDSPAAPSVKGTSNDLIKDETTDILSAELLDSIIHELKLDQTWANRYKPDTHALTDQEALSHLRSVVNLDFPNKGTFVLALPEPGSSPLTWFIETRPLIFKITAQSETPQEAADIANAFVSGYKRERDREDFERNQRGLNSIKEQVVDQGKLTDEAESISAKSPNDLQARVKFLRAQALLGALNIRLKTVIADQKLTESPVRILTRAVAPPE